MAQRTRRGAPSEWSSYNREALEWDGWGGRRTTLRHTCHRQSPGFVQAPVLEDGELRGVKRMLIWQLPNYPWLGQMANTHAKWNGRLRMKERVWVLWWQIWWHILIRRTLTSEQASDYNYRLHGRHTHEHRWTDPGGSNCIALFFVCDTIAAYISACVAAHGKLCTPPTLFIRALGANRPAGSTLIPFNTQQIRENLLSIYTHLFFMLLSTYIHKHVYLVLLTLYNNTSKCCPCVDFVCSPWKKNAY